MRCGSCKSEHDTVVEVRECYADARSEALVSTKTMRAVCQDAFAKGAVRTKQMRRASDWAAWKREPAKALALGWVPDHRLEQIRPVRYWAFTPTGKRELVERDTPCEGFYNEEAYWANELEMQERREAAPTRWASWRSQADEELSALREFGF